MCSVLSGVVQVLSLAAHWGRLVLLEEQAEGTDELHIRPEARVRGCCTTRALR